MTPPAGGRGPGLLLASLGLLALVAAAVRWSVVEGGVATVAAAVLALCGGLLVLVLWWVLRRAAATQARLLAEIARLQAARQEFAAAQDRFVVSLTHEVMTPLTIVMNHAELLSRCSGDPVSVRSHAKSLTDYVLHLAALSETYLNLAGPIDSADTKHHQAVCLFDLILDVVSRAQSMASGREVAIVATLPEPSLDGDTVEVFGDPVMLGAMVESLMRNAVRGSLRGSQVELRVSDLGASIVLEVRDHGPALEPAHIESVFDWFCQGPGATPATPRLAGPGRGLAMARRVAELHRGAITVRNHPEGGCEVVITLPRWLGDGSSSADRGLSAGASSLARPA